MSHCAAVLSPHAVIQASAPLQLNSTSQCVLVECMWQHSPKSYSREMHLADRATSLGVEPISAMQNKSLEQTDYINGYRQDEW